MKAGDRVKTDRRDVMMLAKLHRAGELTPGYQTLLMKRCAIWCEPGQQRSGCCPRHGSICRAFSFVMTGFIEGLAWTLAYRRWLTAVRFDHPAQQIVLQDYIHAVEDAELRRHRLTRQIEELMPKWSMRPSPQRFKRCAGSLSSSPSRWWRKSAIFDASPMLVS
jgi:hypothetical protein